MAPKAGRATPMPHVADMARSIRFYELLGLELVDTQGEPPGWARLHCEGAAIMLSGHWGKTEHEAWEQHLVEWRARRG
jgi:catechol 2,3-dioxygenase-like lactoylglutathione lyase family enzyme